jgi:MHS family proline/betaine transporter-like MFS transporter
MTSLAMMGGAISGTAYIFVISLFTPEQRFTGVAFSYNLGIAVFGGTSPLISRWLVEATQVYHAPAFYITTTSLAFLLALYKMRHVVKNA